MRASTFCVVHFVYDAWIVSQSVTLVTTEQAKHTLSAQKNTPENRFPGAFYIFRIFYCVSRLLPQLSELGYTKRQNWHSYGNK